MKTDEIISIFDEQAPNYDSRWKRMAPVSDALYFFVKTIFARLPEKARILCVGAGTGKEIVFLSKYFPDWRFTVVEPSQGMIDVCRKTMENEDLTQRCIFHEGFLDSLPKDREHDAATCFFVSQFILEQDERSDFFKQIAIRLKPKRLLVSADLVADIFSKEYSDLLELWLKVMSDAEVEEPALHKMKKIYENDVAVLPSQKVKSIIASGGFDTPVRFYQAGLIQAFFAQRSKEID